MSDSHVMSSACARRIIHQSDRTDPGDYRPQEDFERDGYSRLNSSSGRGL